MTVPSIRHISEKPWGDFTQADYTVEQWANACIIHQYTGKPTSKDQCKLPVRTPDGALNRNGVHAAAAALAGARGGVIASAEEKAKAAKTLVRLYKELGEDPPSSLLSMPMMKQSDSVSDFLEHHGVKGMKWGQHRFGRAQKGAHGGDKPPWHSPPSKKAPTISSRPVKKGFFGRTKPQKILSEEARQLHEIRMKAKKHGIHSLTNKELETVNKRLELQQKYQKAHPKKRNPVVDLFLDTVLSDQGSTKIKSLMASKGADKNLMNLVEAAFLVNKSVRTKK